MSHLTSLEKLLQGIEILKPYLSQDEPLDSLIGEYVPTFTLKEENPLSLSEKESLERLGFSINTSKYHVDWIG